MSQRDDIQSLRDEVADLRKQISALAVAITELAVKQPLVQYVPHYLPQPRPLPQWQRPWITWSSSGISENP